MAHNNAFFLIALLMFATATPLAHAQLLGGLGGLLDLGNLLGLVPGGNSVSIGDIPESLLPSIINLLQGLDISGMLCCTPTGNCPAAGGPPLSGAVLNLNCTSKSIGSSIIGQGRTDINGHFNITVDNIGGKILNILEELPCQISVLVDQLVCPVLSVVDGAVLSGVLTPVSLALNQVPQLILNTVTSLN